MTHDPALDLFLQDAQRQGLSLAEYERKYGVILEGAPDRPAPAELRIRRHEVPGGTMNEDDFALAAHRERRRAEARRTT